MTAPSTSIMVIGLLFLLLGVPMLDGCRIVRISDNHPPSHDTQMTTYTLTDMTSSEYPVYRSDTSDWYLYHIPDKWVIGKTVGATEGYSMFVKSDHFNADEITGTFFIRYHGVWRASPNVRVSCTVENVALGKPASQSSTDGSNTADLAVDGEKGTSVPDGQCTLTNAEIDPWWEVALERDWPISTVRVLNRGDCCGRLLENFEVRIKGEWQSWESSEICGTPYRQKLSNGQSITVDCGRPIVGRHVRIQLPARSDTDVLSVCEVEVYPGLGCPDGYIVHGGFCYKPHNTPMTLQNAQATCQQDGGTLAMPRHRHTNEFPPVNLADVGYQPFGGAFLPAFPVRMKFEEAEAACDRFGGGRLAQPTTKEFNDRLMSVAGETSPDESFWIGLKMYEDFWLWSDGTPSETSYSNWAPGEPSGEGCVTTTSAGEWSVKSCDETAFYICQIGDESLCEMEPHTTVRCGGTVSGSSGHILSPGYGKHLNIPDELDCEWKIPVPAGMVIKFTVVDFQVEDGSLEIFDFCPYGRSVKILSGSIESSLDITNNADEAFLKFSSNGLQPTHGFNISYQAIQRPPGLQISQGDTGTRQKRAVLAGLAIKTGLKKVASFVSDILFNIAGLVFDAVGSASVEGEQQHQHVMEKLNLLERKIDGIHEEIQELGIIEELRHDKEIAAQLYSASEQRIKNLQDTLHNRLQITINGTLEPVSLAQEWVETVLRQDSEGMNQVKP
ncbi:uncharacterized protein LOC118407442 [Branchiostoma floridae]|uniref:Uncharacterized protein LOC118407442 n=1 Tax=Branchiostoma floridae TaxID=7739 RepID=A0A9J7HUV5_BRAFL|nr:uncharacterized protein LOC118407442 [Branchiostoma floridae]